MKVDYVTIVTIEFHVTIDVFHWCFIVVALIV